ncbi:MAG: hypothetical protein QW568_00465 [Candidatus Anstonellaceae archaeon]
MAGGKRMVAFTFDPLYHSLLVFLSAMIPGIALGWPFLKKSELSVLEKLLLCFFIGLIVPPSLLIVENIVGLKFSFALVIANLLLVTGAGIVYGIREGAFSFSMPKPDFDSMLSLEFAKKHAATFFLLLAVLLSFWIRIQSYSPIYSELDPYFYVYGSGQLIRLGTNPVREDTAWWPEVTTADHRGFPSLKMYTEAQWYSLYTKGGEYNNYLMFVTSSWLPPISAALLALGAYLLFSAMYGKRYGVLAAFLAAFLPVTIFKMSAGVNEAAPFGMASIFLVFGIYSLALRKKDLAIGAVAGLAFMAAVLGTNYESVLAIPAAAFIVLQAADYFVREKKNGIFLNTSLLLVAGLAAGTFIEGIYARWLDGALDIFAADRLPVLAAIALAYGLANVERFANVTNQQRKVAIAACAAICLAVLLVPNPIGNYAKTYVKNYIGAADFNFPLQRTIAEQNVAGAIFEGEGGFLAFVPAAHEIAAPKDLKESAWNLLDAVLGAVAAVFSYIGNAAIGLVSATSNMALWTNINTVPKADSLLFFFVEVASIGIVARHFARKGEGREEPNTGMLVLLLALPILYIGLNKIKFTIFVGLALLLAAVAAVAELEKALLWLARKAKLHEHIERRIRAAFIVAIMLLAYAQVTTPSSYPVMILKKSFEPRYQDNPAALMPKLASTCESLRALGYYDAEICAAGYNASFADSINSQFDSKVCLVSQLSMKELVPGQSVEEQQISSEAKAGASFRCNRLADYWIDSMEWINKNLQPEDRVTSWWDYGHWINYFGDRKTVLRNEHASTGMIGRVAHDYIDGTTQQLIDSMNYFDSRYVLFDVELIGGSSFGGKYGALNYLACAHDNGTSVAQPPGTSDCEFEHSPERVAIPKIRFPGTECAISESQQRIGVIAYSVKKNGIDQTKPVYCVGETTLVNGEKVSATYYIDRKDEDGDLVLSKGFLRQVEDSGQVGIYELVYNELPVWPGKNGTFVGGMEDAKTKFYTSNLYRGFYLENLPGFDLVYKSKNGEVKIYRLQNFTGNKEGRIDPVSAAKNY